MDQDYINKLNDKEKEWLSKFNEEEYGNKLSKKTKRSKTQRKRIYDQTNARNRDLFNVGIKWNNGGTGASKYHHTEDDDSEIVSSEDAVIQELDIKRDIEAGRLIIPNDDD